ncbi:MAG: arylesterase [Gammaproteobacteria bacterium WSBS_2016_MAG_OTU1]
MKLCLIISLFFAFVGGHAAAKEINIAAFGDSLSAGYGLPEKDGFAAALQRVLSENDLAITVSNAGVSGETSADGLTRVEWMLRKNPDMVIVEFGANDMFRGTPIAAIRQNLAGIVKKIQQHGAQILLVGMQAPANYPLSYRSQFTDMYQQLSEENNIELYPFFLEGVALDPSLNLQDGIHPNAEGIRIIANNIAPSVMSVIKQIP